MKESRGLELTGTANGTFAPVMLNPDVEVLTVVMLHAAVPPFVVLFPEM